MGEESIAHAWWLDLLCVRTRLGSFAVTNPTGNVDVEFNIDVIAKIF
jgi:hypothetical protein